MSSETVDQRLEMRELIRQLTVIAATGPGWQPPSGMTAAVAGTLGGLTALVLFWQHRRLIGTTLVAPWCWAIMSLIAVAGSELWIGLASAGGHGPGWAAPLRFAAAVSTFCPVMALLGAKRPQDRAWKFIVLSLWGILALPAAEVFFLQRGDGLQIHDARAWFLWILMAVGVSNSLPTRFWGAAILFGGGQIALFGPHLPLLRQDWGTAGVLAGLAFFLAAALWTGWASRAGRCAEPSLDRLWLDFRDAFGLLWGLRVAERINATSASSGWNITLGWTGFRCSDDGAVGTTGALEQLPPDIQQSLARTFKSLLRRFVSSEWIAHRLPSDRSNR